MLNYYATPTQEIHDPVLHQAGIRLFIKREDLNHPHVSGNKWWKLKYNLMEARRLSQKAVLTFGGSYSNHIYATAAAAHEAGFRSLGIIRGEEVLPLNATLRFACEKGMDLHYVSRETYRKKSEEDYLHSLRVSYGDFYLIPEGGSNALAVQGVAEFSKMLGSQFDYLCCPVGTGGTLAGLIRGLEGEKKVIGFSVLRDGAYLNNEVRHFGAQFENWEISTEYHFGGYARSTPELLQFISDFKLRHDVPLEFIYTAKMLYGILDLSRKGYFPKGSRLLAIHTGGIRT